MITLYSVPRYPATVKARKWLRNHKLAFKEVNLVKNPKRMRQELLHIISLLEGDVESLISKRTKRYQGTTFALEELSLSELIDYLIEHPTLLRKPVISDGRTVQIGFNPEEIRAFIPRQVRQVELNRAKEQIDERRFR